MKLISIFFVISFLLPCCCRLRRYFQWGYSARVYWPWPSPYLFRFLFQWNQELRDYNTHMLSHYQIPGVKSDMQRTGNSLRGAVIWNLNQNVRGSILVWQRLHSNSVWRMVIDNWRFIPQFANLRHGDTVKSLQYLIIEFDIPRCHSFLFSLQMTRCYATKSTPVGFFCTLCNTRASMLYWLYALKFDRQQHHCQGACQISWRKA